MAYNSKQTIITGKNQDIVGESDYTVMTGGQGWTKGFPTVLLSAADVPNRGRKDLGDEGNRKTEVKVDNLIEGSVTTATGLYRHPTEWYKNVVNQ